MDAREVRILILSVRDGLREEINELRDEIHMLKLELILGKRDTIPVEDPLKTDTGI